MVCLIHPGLSLATWLPAWTGCLHGPPWSHGPLLTATLKDSQRFCRCGPHGTAPFYLNHNNQNFSEHEHTNRRPLLRNYRNILRPRLRQCNFLFFFFFNYTFFFFPLYFILRHGLFYVALSVLNAHRSSQVLGLKNCTTTASF